MSVSASQPPPPERLGRYEVIERLGMGGMAEVLLAVRRGPGTFAKAVALKRMLPQLAARPEFIRSMQFEAAVAAMMHHPNVVQVNELEQADGEYFLSMELLYGLSLSQLAKLAERAQDPFPLGAAVRIIADAARGLDYVHSLEGADGKNLGIIHRDISPQNLFVTDGGTTKVVDFGIAKAVEVLESDTRTGVLKGKHPFMSPEQVSFLPIDSRTDVWGLGVTLWELLCSRRLFAKEGFIEVLEAIKEDPIPRPSSIRPDVPTELDAIVLRTLERDPAKRTQTAGQFAEQLEQLARRLPLSSHADVGVLVMKYAKNRIKRLKSATSAASGSGRLSRAPAAMPAPEPTRDDATVEATPSAHQRVVAARSGSVPAAPAMPSLPTPARSPAHTNATGTATKDLDADPFAVTVTPSNAPIALQLRVSTGDSAPSLPSMEQPSVPSAPSAPTIPPTSPTLERTPSRTVGSLRGSSAASPRRRLALDALALGVGLALGLLLYRLLF